MVTRKEIKREIKRGVCSKFKDTAPKTKGETNQYNRGYTHALEFVLKEEKEKKDPSRDAIKWMKVQKLFRELMEGE